MVLTGSGSIPLHPGCYLLETFGVKVGFDLLNILMEFRPSNPPQAGEALTF